MLYYLYHADYDASSFAAKSLSAPMLHVKLHIMADKYFIEHLRATALTKLKEDVETSWKADSFAETVAEVYSSTLKQQGGTDHELRKAVVEVTREHAKVLFAHGGQYAKFKEMAWSTPEFAADVTRAVTGAAA